MISEPLVPLQISVSKTPEYEENRVVCDQILALLPDWFGPFAIYEDYLDDLKNRPVFTASSGLTPIGIMALTQTSDASIDIHLMAVVPNEHGKGVGRAMIKEAIEFARNSGAKFLTVKTLGPSRDNAAYAKTRGFYESQGFSPIEEFIDFWGEGYPMLLLCQPIK